MSPTPLSLAPPTCPRPASDCPPLLAIPQGVHPKPAQDRPPHSQENPFPASLAEVGPRAPATVCRRRGSDGHSGPAGPGWPPGLGPRNSRRQLGMAGPVGKPAHTEVPHPVKTCLWGRNILPGPPTPESHCREGDRHLGVFPERRPHAQEPGGRGGVCPARGSLAPGPTTAPVHASASPATRLAPGTTVTDSPWRAPLGTDPCAHPTSSAGAPSHSGPLRETASSAKVTCRRLVH